MVYCSSAELILESGSTLATNILDSIISVSDRKIKTRLLRKGLTPPASDDSLKTASIELSKAGIVTYNRITGAQTKSVEVGDITINLSECGDWSIDDEIKITATDTWKRAPISTW